MNWIECSRIKRPNVTTYDNRAIKIATARLLDGTGSVSDLDKAIEQKAAEYLDTIMGNIGLKRKEGK